MSIQHEMECSRGNRWIECVKEDFQKLELRDWITVPHLGSHIPTVKLALGIIL